jgi:cytochrome c-type biogenesis protein CcmE
MDTPQTQRTPSSKRRAKFALGGFAVFVILAGLVVWATTRQGSISFYMTPTELLAAGEAQAGDSYRVNGEVVPGSISKEGLSTSFTISDGTTEIDVVTDRPLPDTFMERSDVVARGNYDGSVFTADEVLAKCPSKFKAKA